MKNFVLLLALIPTIALADSDSDLNAVYKSVISNNDQIKTHIIKSQIDWLKFIKSNCTASELKNGALGTGLNSNIQSCINDEKKARTEYLKETYLNF